MPFTPRDTVANGRGKAARMPKGVLDPRLSEVVREFHSFKSDDARAAFAHRWVTLTADQLNQTWPVFYELLALIQKRHLYRDPDLIFAPSEKGRRAYESFEEYFEDRLQQPFTAWAELEATYQFVTARCPELLRARLDEATAARVAAQAEEFEDQPLDPPRTAGPGRGHKTGSNDTCFIRGSGNTEYLTRRLARDRPDLIERMKGGEFKSVRAAALEAGIVKPTVSFPREVDAAARALARHFTPAELRAIFAQVLAEREAA